MSRVLHTNLKMLDCLSVTYFVARTVSFFILACLEHVIVSFSQSCYFYNESETTDFKAATNLNGMSF